MKPTDPQVAALVPDPALPGEDCLNLNVWTPDLGAVGLPVMVWIHGGMFEVGSGASYDGSRFARDGVVCVTINYRVGAEGFLLLEDGEANLGLQDQVAALRWVRDNIAAFGGDPGNVTIFGESAGAMCVGTLLALPSAAGLFRRAIAQSGAAHHVQSAESARRVGLRLAEKVGVPATQKAMSAVPWERLLAGAGELKAELVADPDPGRWGLEVALTQLPWQPAVDGEILPGQPLDLITAGAGATVDLLVGTNTEEWRLFSVLSGVMDQVTEESLIGPVSRYRERAFAAYGLPGTALPVYQAAYPGVGPGDLFAAVQTDWWCRVPALRLAEAHLPSPSATYMYEFAWPSPAFEGRLGACHALEIPFVFDTLELGAAQMAGPLLGPTPPQELARSMHAAWVAFARTGDPGWPAYDMDRRATMRFNVKSRVVDDPRLWERNLWEGVR